MTVKNTKKTMDMNSPLVSVVVPVYNACQYLRQTLDCICKQTLKDIEIILVDDGSTDGSLEVLREYERNDARITVLLQEHEYAGAARNKGMAIAKGKYFSFLDADDIFEPNMLELMVNRAEEEQAEVVICRSEIFYKEGEYKPLSWALKDSYLKGVDLRRFSFKDKAASVAFQSVLGWPWDKLFLRSYVENNGFKFGLTRHGNDGPFVFPATYAADRVSVVDEVLVKYRQMGNQISAGSNLSKNPTAGCTSVKCIYDAMSKLALPNETWQSFYVWVATYVRWNMKKFDVKGKTNLRDYLSETFEPQLEVVNRTVACGVDKLEEYKDFVSDMRWYKSIVSPAISVVVPVFNASQYLVEALDSLQKQTFCDFEAICVNDGSTDDSLDILNKYASQDARFSVIDVPNGGYGKAMNLGLQRARGKYFAILEPDDCLPVDAYQKLFTLAENHNLEIVRGKFTRFHTAEDGTLVYREENDYADVEKIVSPRDFCHYFYNMSMATWCGLYRLDYLRRHKIEYYESPGASYQDTGFFMQAYGYADRAMYTNDVVYLYRTDNTASSTNTKSAKFQAMQKEFAFIKEKYKNHSELWPLLQELYLLRRMAAHRWIYNSIPESSLADYLLSFREELLALRNVSRERFIPVDKLHYEQLLISPEYFLSNAGCLPDSQRALSQLANPFRKSSFVSTSRESGASAPAISVIVPVYSGMEYFALVIAMLRSQTLRNMEYIFVDDCSIDGTFALAELAAADDSRVKLVRNQSNKGPGFSRNQGMSVATGEYIAFMDADDIIPADFYEKLYNKAKETGALVVKCGRANRKEDGRIEVSLLNERIKEYLAQGEHLVNAFGWEHTTAIYQREHVLRNQARNSDCNQDEDTTFILGVLHNLDNNQFAMVEDLYYYYRENSDSLTQKLAPSYLTESVKSFIDKLNFISEQPSTPSLDTYVANLIYGRLWWRYKRTLQEPAITQSQRENYLVQIVDIARAYCSKHQSVSLYGIARELVQGETTITDYMKSLDESKQIVSASIDKEHRQKEMQARMAMAMLKYYRYKLLAGVTFGKKKQRYIQKKKGMKTFIREYRKLKKELKYR